MKENLIEKESEELISEEIYEIENKNKKNNSKEINLIFLITIQIN